MEYPLIPSSPRSNQAGKGGEEMKRAGRMPGVPDKASAPWHKRQLTLSTTLTTSQDMPTLSRFPLNHEIHRKKHKTSRNNAVPHAKEGKEAKECRGENYGVDAAMHPWRPWLDPCSASFCAAKIINPVAVGDRFSPGPLARNPSIGTGSRRIRVNPGIGRNFPHADASYFHWKLHQQGLSLRLP